MLAKDSHFQKSDRFLPPRHNLKMWGKFPICPKQGAYHSQAQFEKLCYIGRRAEMAEDFDEPLEDFREYME